MRKIVYTVAAVLALAPLAAIAPASAAVAHPAAAQATCSGGWPEVNVSNYNDNSLDYVGSWHDVSGVVADSYSRKDVFCMVQPNASEDGYAFREKGTTDCVVYTPSQGTITIKGCDYSSSNQLWLVYDGSDSGGDLSPFSDLNQCLDGSGADTVVFMNSCGATPDNQYWETNGA